MLPTDLHPYPAYKPSSVEWLGDVPKHWDVRRLKTLCSRFGLYGANVAANHYHETGVRFLRTTDITDNGRLRTSGVFVPEALVSDYLLSDGDILISRSGTIGRSLLYQSKSHGRCAYAGYLVRFVPNSEILPKYVFLFTKTQAFEGFLRVMAISSTIENVNADKYANAHLPLPPLDEQAAIVLYLDYVDRRVRRYVSAKERLIGLLEEEKQAVINRAVTRGLDSSVPLKPSGVEWLGDVPAHWERCRLRNVVSEVTTGSRGWSSYASDAGPLFIRIGNLNRGSLQLRFDDMVRLNLPKTSEAIRTRIRPGDLLISVTAYIGSVGIAPEEFEESYVSQHVARCRPRPGSSSQWLGYVLLSTVGQTHGQISLYGGTKDGLSLDDVKNYEILLPPLAEQTAIVEYIDKATADIDASIARARRQIELLQEYRTRLVADVVTGKLDVREAAAGLPDEADDRDPIDGSGRVPDNVNRRVREANGAVGELATEGEVTV